MVKEGDTLYELSKKYDVPLQTLIEANPQIANPDVLTIGEKVKIPSAAVPVAGDDNIVYKHVVKQGDSLWKLSKAWGVSLKSMIDANPQLKNPNALLVGEVVNIPSGTHQAPQIGAESEGNVAPIGKKNTAPKPAPVPPKAEAEAPAPPKAEEEAPAPVAPNVEVPVPAPLAPKAEVPAPEQPAIPIPVMPVMPEAKKPDYHYEVQYSEINIEKPPVYNTDYPPMPIAAETPYSYPEIKPIENLSITKQSENVSSFYDFPQIPVTNTMPAVESLSGNYPGITNNPYPSWQPGAVASDLNVSPPLGAFTGGPNVSPFGGFAPDPNVSAPLGAFTGGPNVSPFGGFAPDPNVSAPLGAFTGGPNVSPFGGFTPDPNVSAPLGAFAAGPNVSPFGGFAPDPNVSAPYGALAPAPYYEPPCGCGGYAEPAVNNQPFPFPASMPYSYAEPVNVHPNTWIPQAPSYPAYEENAPFSLPMSNVPQFAPASPYGSNMMYPNAAYSPYGMPMNVMNPMSTVVPASPIGGTGTDDYFRKFAEPGAEKASETHQADSQAEIGTKSEEAKAKVSTAPAEKRSGKRQNRLGQKGVKSRSSSGKTKSSRRNPWISQ
nr:LysM peptidoglycan-binding domain-containing protein [Paenibacillus caui]